MVERYDIKKKIGAGGAGAVYEALDTMLDRKVAIKRLLAADEAESPELTAGSLQKETAALSALQHPNIVTIFDVDADEDGPFVVMELIEGFNIEEVVERETLEADVFVEFAEQTLDALAAAQSLDLLHRDIKPRNLMIRWLPDGKPLAKVLDFGLAKFAPKPAMQTMDHNKAVMGSVFYMAPEQFERRPLDRRTDLYSLGSVFYYALSGHDPFDGKSAVDVMNAHLEHRVRHLSDFRPDLARPVADWVMWLMNRKMDDRPQSAEEALSVLATLRKEGEGEAANEIAESVELAPPTRGTNRSRNLRLTTGGVPRTKERRTLVASSTGAVMERDATTGLVPDLENGQLRKPRGTAKRKTTGTYVVAKGATAPTGLASSRVAGRANAALIRNTQPVGGTGSKPGRGLIVFGIVATGLALVAVAIVLVASLNKSGDDSSGTNLGQATFSKGDAEVESNAPAGTPEWYGSGVDDLFSAQNWLGNKVPKEGGEGLVTKGPTQTMIRMNRALSLTVAGTLEVERYYDVIGFGKEPGFLKIETGGKVTIGTKTNSKLVIGRETSGWTEVKGGLSIKRELEIGDTEGTTARLTVDGGSVSTPRLVTGNCDWQVSISDEGKVMLSNEANFQKGRGKIQISKGGLLRCGTVIGLPRSEVEVTIESGGKFRMSVPDAESVLRGWIENGSVRSTSPLEVKKVVYKGKTSFEITSK